MAKHRAAWWQKRVDEWAAGGDPEAIARRHSVTTNLLLWWRSELSRRARRVASDSAPAFLPVVVGAASTPITAMTTSEASSTALDLVVEVGAARMSLRGSIGAAHIEAIVRGLVTRC
jgi:transposase-like protein